MRYGAMRDELVKIAISMKEMQAAYRRLPIMRFKPGASTSNKGVNALLSTRADEALVGSIGGPSTIGPSSVIGQLLRAKGALPHVADDMAAGSDEVTRSILRGAPSKVLMTRGGGHRALGRSMEAAEGLGYAQEGTGELMKRMSPAGKKGFNMATGLHEQFEQDATKRILGGQARATPMASHVHPEVIAKEHNMLRSMTGEGADEARQAFQSLRGGAQGEAANLNEILGGMYGPRAQLSYGSPSAPKIPKAMRKDMRRRLQGSEAEQVQLGLMQRAWEAL
jgi:hypothetical protein